MTTDIPDPDMTAAELALGLLDGDERAVALRRVVADPAFAREVEEWRHRLAGLFDDYPEVAAPDAVGARVATPAPVRRARWPFVATIFAIAAAVALFFVVRPAPSPVAPPPHILVASLIMTDKSAALPAVVDLSRDEMSVSGTTPVPLGKSAQLWLIGSDGVPKPLGLLASSGPSRMKVTHDVAAQLGEGVTLAVSIEPAGGSPTGKPTGPVIASGKLATA